MKTPRPATKLSPFNCQQTNKHMITLSDVYTKYCEQRNIRAIDSKQNGRRIARLIAMARKAPERTQDDPYALSQLINVILAGMRSRYTAYFTTSTNRANNHAWIERRDASTFIQRLRTRPLSPTEFRYDRAVGLEIECFGPSLGDKLPVWCREAIDGSLRWHTSGPERSMGIEFRCLISRATLEHKLNRICSLLVNHKVNKSCGLHVHLDMRGKTLKEVTKIARHYNKWLYALREFLPQSRRDNNAYCKWGVSSRDRYHAVNMCSFERHRTLEIRVHSGTTDFTKIISWIRLLELIAVINKAPKAEGVAALASLPLVEYERAYWLLRHRELNPGQYTNPTPSTEIE